MVHSIRARSLFGRSLAIVAAGLLSTAVFGDEAPKAKEKRPDIYDAKADGQRQIAEALVEAKRDHKRVLLQFGANWCVWCHRLDDLFARDKDLAKELQYEYVVVLIDVDKVEGKTHNQAVVDRYGNPTKLGLPVLVLLDEDGKQLTTQETGAFEVQNGHDPAKVLAFLKQWRATPPSAEEALAAGLTRAKAESKALFVDFSAPWCVWCRRLDEYLRRAQIAEIFDAAYVTAKIDVERFKGGKELLAKHGGENAGLPFFVVLDAEGKKLADSMAEPGGNVGFPAAPEEIAHFVKVIRQSSPKLGEDQIRVLANGLSPKERSQ